MEGNKADFNEWLEEFDPALRSKSPEVDSTVQVATQLP
jgi:hypothetical protein